MEQPQAGPQPGLRRALAIPVFEAPPSGEPDTEPRAIEVGDLDGDGRTDFVLLAHDRGARVAHRLAAFDTRSGTMMLGFPEWIVYTCMVPGLALTALIALVQAARGFDPSEAAAS